MAPATDARLPPEEPVAVADDDPLADKLPAAELEEVETAAPDSPDTAVDETLPDSTPEAVALSVALAEAVALCVAVEAAVALSVAL